MNTQVIKRTELEGIEQAPVRVGASKSSWIGRVIEDIRDWQRYRSAVRELSLLDDARLKDIGIVRGEIRTVVRQAMQARKARLASRSEAMETAA